MCLFDKLSRHARAIARTVSAQSVLRYLIKRQQTISYEELAEAIDMTPDGSFVRILATVARQDKSEDRAITTAIVVGKNGLPSSGFFDHAERQGWFDPWDYAGRSPDEEPELSEDEIRNAKRSFWKEQMVALGYEDPDSDGQYVTGPAQPTAGSEVDIEVRITRGRPTAVFRGTVPDDDAEPEPTLGRRRQVGVATVETVIAED
jgi:hypothetical protein